MTAAIYLDHAATTPVDPDVRAAMLPFLTEHFGNPSSVHAAGRAARAAVDAARDRLAAVLDCAQREIVFTGSGSEADNLALRGALERHGADAGRHLVVSAIEHDAVLETAGRLQETGAAEVTVVPCDPSGVVEPAAVAEAVRDDTLLVSVMLVNNETGVIQDVAALAAAARERKPTVLVHTDAVQGLGRLQVHPHQLGVDLLSLSAHKVYGPQGVGALWVRHGVNVAAAVTGGGQERNRRSGTENVAGVVGFAAAAALADQLRAEEMSRQRALCDQLRHAVRAAVPDAVITGDDARRAGGFATFAFYDVRTDLLLALLDEAGIYASGGSACASGAPTPSHVLTAMGLAPELAAGALRCTVGRATTSDHVATAGRAIAAAVERLRASARAGSRQAEVGAHL